MLNIKRINDEKIIAYGTKNSYPTKIKGAEIIGDYIAHRMLIAGQSGSGKSVLAYNILKRIISPTKTKLYIFSRTAEEDPSYKSFKKGMESLETEIYRSTIVDGISLLPSIIKNNNDEQIISHGEEVPKCAVLMDDLTRELKRDPYIEELTKQIRHIRSPLLIVIHDLKDIQRCVRQELTLVFMFRGFPKERFMSFMQDWGFPTEVPHTTIYDIYKTLVKKNKFLMLNKINGNIHLNLNKLITIE